MFDEFLPTVTVPAPALQMITVSDALGLEGSVIVKVLPLLQII